LLHKGGDSHIANDRHERANLLTAEHVSLYPIEEIASRTGAEQIANHHRQGTLTGWHNEYAREEKKREFVVCD